MDVFLLLDILLLMLIALFVPIGFWRGAHREVLVTLGILFGAALADSWARPWGQDLAQLTRLRESGGAFMVAVLFVIGSTFLLGYGAGSALAMPRPGLISRFFGALIAGGNGALLLSFALRDIRIYLLADQNPDFLEQAIVAHFLSTGVGWLLLGGLVVFLPVVVVLALFGRGGYVDPEMSGASEATREVAGVYGYAPRLLDLSNEGDTAVYKAEPPRAYDSPTVETRPVWVRSDQDQSAAWGGAHHDLADDEQTVIARVRSEGADDAQETIQIDTAGGHTPVTDGTCPACHADVSEAEVFCPRCGRVL